MATLAEASTLLQVAKEVKPRPLTTCDSLAARMERTTARVPHHKAVIFEGKTLSWSELNAHANRYAAALQARGLLPGDSVSLVMENRIEFLTTLIALNKLGVIAALINTNLFGKPLIHCIKITGSKMCIFGEERLEAIDQVRSDAELSVVQSSVGVKEKNQYRIFFSDRRAVTLTMNDGKVIGFTRQYYDKLPVCICATENSTGEEEIFFGSTDGFVYQMDSGTSFNGNAIEAALNKVSSRILEDHLNSCVITAIQGNDIKERERVLKEITEVFEMSTKV